MKKIILLFFLLVVLVGCSRTSLNANMYEIKDYKCEEEFDDYYYEILNTYEDYQKNKNYERMNSYSKDYFSNSSLVIIFIKDSTNANKYALKDSFEFNNVLKVSLERVSQGLSQVFSTVSYCIEIESKNIKSVEINKIMND